MKKFFLLLFATALVSSCSSTSTKTSSLVIPSESVNLEKTQKNAEGQAQLSFEETSKHLKKLISKAMAEGGMAQEYLETDLYLKASDASLHGDTATALFLYEHLRILKPKDTYLKRRHAVELIRDGRLDDSEKLLSELFVDEKHDEGVGLIWGGVLTALEKKKQARDVYELVVKHNPKSEEACVFLAKSYAVEKMYKKADKLLTKCEKRIKGKALFAYYKGKIELGREKSKLAFKHFKRALKINSKYFQAALGMGLIHEENKKTGKAIAVYERFLKKTPSNLPILSRLVQLLFIEGDGKKIIPYAERLASLDSSDLNLKVRLGILYTDVKEYSKAIGIFKEILSAVPESDKILYYLGSLFQQVQEEEESLNYFSRIPSSSTLFHDSQIQMAQILHAKADEGKTQGDEAEVQRFVSFIKENSNKHEGLRVEFMVILAGYYESSGDFVSAVKEIESVKDEKAFADGHRYYLASLYEKNSKFDEARGIIQEILKNNPENPHALNFLGYSMVERGENMDQAFKYIRKAVDLKPEDGFIRDSLGWYYYKVGNLKEALKEIKRAFEATKTDVVITKHLAIIYQNMQRYELAKKFYLKALKNCKTQTEIVEVRKALETLENIRLPASVKKPAKK